MNTLSRAMTAQFYPNLTGNDAQRQHYALKKHWSALMNSPRKHELAASHHLLYLALLGKDWRKAFTPVTNPKKLANGAFLGWALFRAFMQLHSQICEELLLAPFQGIVTPEMLRAVRRYLPAPKAWDFTPEAFVLGSFPLDAYISPVESALNA